MSVKTTSSDNFDGEKKKIKKLGNRDIGTLLLMLYDLLVAPVSYLAALWIRFDCRYTAIPGNYFSAWLKFAPIYAAICLVVYMWRHLYQSLWKFASFVELRRILVSSVILGALHAALITLLFARMPISYYLMGITIQTAMSLFARFGYRFVSLERGKRAKTQSL
ncbi:MAG: polysaccharide biosynthesis protein, partial [Clostridia bacterium]|nr:polysaccharide biosynthesis protein [Clostridia bacterium]